MSSWTASYKDVKSFVDEVYDLIRSASEVENSGQQSAQRGACRRKLQSLTTKIDDLERSLDNEQVTQREASRRSELVSALKVRRDQLKGKNTCVSKASSLSLSLSLSLFSVRHVTRLLTIECLFLSFFRYAF